MLLILTLPECRVNGQDFENHTVPVSQDYIDAFDAAVQDMIVDRTFIDAYFNLMYFPVPACINDLVKYPSKNPFANRKALVMCMETGVISPYKEVKHMVGNTIVQKINDRYGTKLQVQFKYLNTSQLGFFTTMKNGVDSGECDLISSNTTPTDARKAVAHFQCNYGMTSQAFIRTNKDGHLSLKTLQDLNQTQVVVGAYSGTTYETLVKTQLSAAKFVSYQQSDDQYASIKKSEVHAVIGDAVTFLVWVRDNKDVCSNCSVILYTNPYGYGTFTTKLIASGASSVHHQIWFMSVLLAMVCMMGMFYSH
ncbi:hypothetical protein C9374_008686 [Naegleria lovaniensis]|uniref:Solute-binding protein family 3/N-terminal domain-containing protein n=1 Tax=Naegleria lovaniensis TaxID=51637 RepID=A0AA88GID9_NAELO|nr:uncharacterized protein C9374_008686 [Naegleria lovaniensis]KAG2378064.1 hypothetical protein C9374_008686 [Naegleria lovaniensis]